MTAADPSARHRFRLLKEALDTATSAISAVVAVASGIATFATTGLAIVRGLDKMVKRE